MRARTWRQRVGNPPWVVLGLTQQDYHTRATRVALADHRPVVRDATDHHPWDMTNEQLAHLTCQMRRARRNLEEDAPYDPAGIASRAWVDDLEREIRDLGIDIGLVVSGVNHDRALVA